MSAKKSKTFFKTLTAILVLLLFFGGVLHLFLWHLRSLCDRKHFRA